MAKRRRTVGLVAFLKGSSNPEDQMPGCSNYDQHHGGCLSGDSCLVETGKRCGYFERAVLPTAADMGLKELVYSMYERQVGIASIGQFYYGNIRKCPDCGAELKPRQRYCENCARRRRIVAYRKSRLNKRSKRHS
jgi:hypothetical protein